MTRAVFTTCPRCRRYMLGQLIRGHVEPQPHTCDAPKTVEVVIAPPERQVWEKRLQGTDIAERRMHLDIDHEARVWIHEVLLTELLTAAGWERVE